MVLTGARRALTVEETHTMPDAPTILLPAAGGQPGLNVAVYATGARLMYPTTPCCGASGKGGGHGVICRACYNDVDMEFGDCAAADAPNAARDVAWWLNVTDARAAELVAKALAL